MESMFRRLLRAAKSERRRAGQNQKGEENADTGMHWDYYRTDMRQYFSGVESNKDEQKSTKGWERSFPTLPAEVATAVAQAKARGRKVIMVDLLGEADGASLGADVTICLALTKRQKDTETHKTITGNVYQTGVQEALFDAIDAEDGDLVFANFAPVGGITPDSSVDPHVPLYTSSQLFRLFAGMYARLAKPSVFAIQTGGGPFLPETKQRFKEWLVHANVPHTTHREDGRVLLRK